MQNLTGAESEMFGPGKGSEEMACTCLREQ